MKNKKLILSEFDSNGTQRPTVKAKDLAELYPDPKEREKAILDSAKKVIHKHKKELIQLADK